MPSIEEIRKRNKRKNLREAILFWVLGVVVVVGILAIAFGTRMLITGGDIGCAFAQDPALCVAVKEK